MKSSESSKNRIAEYQAPKTALESMDQSQVYIMVGSKHLCPPITKPLYCLKNPEMQAGQFKSIR